MANKKKKQNFSRLGGVGLPTFVHYRTLASVSGKYIPCSGNGIAIPTDNKYLETLAKIAADSPTHGAAIQRKSTLTFGQGFNIDELPNPVKTLFENINEDGEGANELLECVADDYAHYLGFAMRVRWTGKTEIAEINYVPFKNVRIGKVVSGKIEYFVVSNDWENKLPQEMRENYRINAFNPDKITAPTFDDEGNPQYDDTTKDNAEQLIWYCKKKASYDGFYPTPDYAQCLDAALTEIETGTAMRNGIENGINGGYLITTKDNTPLDDDSKQSVIDVLNGLATGAENANSLLFLPANVQVTHLQAPDADTYNEINAECKKRIITGHLIPAILVEVNEGGGFNNRAEEMKAAILQFQQTTILAYQQKIVRVFESKILKYVPSGDSAELRIIPFLEEEIEEDKKDTQEQIAGNDTDNESEGNNNESQKENA